MLSYLQSLISQYHNQEPIIWNSVKSINNTNIEDYKTLSSNINKDLLNKVAIIKLNGGLGTSMGCTGPKSTIKVKNALTFLDIICKQVITLNNKHSVNIPLVFMNSLNTELETKKICQEYKKHLEILHFNQNFLPRMDINFKTLSTEYIESEKDLWYPPGHGDIYQALRQSEVFKKLEKRGIKYLFISNSDNLGATIDIKILQSMYDNQKDFIMEVVSKTLADVKGGSLIKYNGKIQLLEVAQVPQKNLDEFYNIEKFKYFNTNNIWVTLDSLKDNNPLMEIIYNPKKLSDGRSIVQLEIAMGSAIKSFKKSGLINVPRTRFRPVKKCQDLFLIMSNLFKLDNMFLLQSTIDKLPLIKFSDDYKKIQDFSRAFPQGIPYISKLESLTLNKFKIFGSTFLEGKVLY
jgi:UTP--glucose-1-phosphate uridylyltransferase